MADFELVVVGGGLASARAICAYRDAGGDGRLALVSKDRWVPYHRPPLSKAYLRGEREREATFVEPEDSYAERGVELLLETTVERVDPDRHRVELAGGRTLEYRRLLLATGAWPRRLPVPGGDLAGVLTLRTLDNSTRIRETAQSGRPAVVVGAGFIGMEVAASLRQLDVAVTMVHRGQALYDQFGCEALSRFLVELYRANGVRLVLDDSVARFRGRDGVEAIETTGGELLEAAFAVVGVGVEPQLAPVEATAIEVENGIVVDDRFRTAAPDVYAVGDVAAFWDPLFERRRRIEHWSNSNYQGTQVGKALAGEDARFDTVSTFFTEVFGTTYRVFGDITCYDDVEVRGSFADGKAVAFYRDGDRFVGAVLTGQDDETEQQLKDAIAARGPVPADIAA
jgi:3-phenylpropionate/trans-cinnamate dioxygenase ferredoxin reductase subunit